jgi:signal transduction histidine kinase
MTQTRSSLAFRAACLAWALAALVVIAAAWTQVGRVFPGFYIDGHGYLGATDMADWPGPRAGLKPLDCVRTVDGTRFISADALNARVREAPVGTAFRYGLADGRTVTVPSALYTVWDFVRMGLVWWLAAIVHLLLGAWVFWKRPDSRAAVAHWRYCQAFAVFLLSGVGAVAWPVMLPINYVGAALMLPAIVELVLGFPGTPVGPAAARRLRLAGRLGGLALLVLVALGYAHDAWFPVMFNFILGVPSIALLAALAVWAYEAASRRFGPDARAQARLALAGMSVSLLPSVVYSTAALLQRPLPGFELAFLGFCAFPAAIAYAIARHRAFELDRLLRRATLYTLLTVALAGVYVAAAALANGALGAIAGEGSGVSLAGFLAAVAVAASLRPAHDGLRRAVDAVFLGKRADPLAAATAMGARAAAGEAPAFAQQLVDLIQEALEATWAALEAPDGTRVASGIAAPDDGPALAVPLPGRPGHRLMAGPRRDEMPHTEAERALLSLLAAQAAIGLDRATLFDERHRLQLAQAEAAARLAGREALFRQVVHDMGTDLSNIAVAADLARQLPGEPGPLASIEASLARIERFLAEKRAQIEAEAAGRETGLAAGVALALEAVAPQAAARGQHVKTSLPREPLALPLSEVELAQVLGNVLSNAVRLSPPGAVITLAVSRADGWVTMRVDDEGPGLAPDMLAALGSGRRAANQPPGSGLGLQNALTIVRAVGGRMAWRNRLVGGATVEIEIPHPPTVVS